MEKRYWLMKTEPETFGIDDLKRVKVEPWSGVRGFRARNYMRDDMQVGDEILFYHSSTKIVGVAGLAKVASKPHRDDTALDKKSDYYDERYTEENCPWVCVDVKFVSKFPRVVTLDEMKSDPKLKGMMVIDKDHARLSIQPVSAAHFEHVVALSVKQGVLL